MGSLAPGHGGGSPVGGNPGELRQPEHDGHAAGRNAVHSRHDRRTGGITAEEVASSIIFLADPANGSTSGTVLPVGGGMRDLLLPPAR